jgi:hypothetical protein
MQCTTLKIIISTKITVLLFWVPLASRTSVVSACNHHTDIIFSYVGLSYQNTYHVFRSVIVQALLVEVILTACAILR